jgi:hypothetical protein
MVAQFFVNDRRRADPNRLIRFSLQFAAAVNFLENRGAAQKIFEFLISPRHLPDRDHATSLHSFDFVTTVRLRIPSRQHLSPLD